MKTINILLVLLIMFSFAANAHGDKHKGKGLFKGIDTPAAKVVLAFHEALETGNKKQARAQLADDVTIYEGGRVERSADEYVHHHMLSDMKYLEVMKSKTLEHQVTILGDTAISASRSHTQGTFKGKERDYQGMETMVLEKQNGEWKIKHIHWSN
ncbi:nuclear transport factor 2 family protein [Pseudoalteromonas sp. MMG024]|uniref:YybH family protein n=1 Tax=Pseudoalteromonas sp. MMG024 TaxID=2909980 RepID=UPI001F1628F6|nr:nuclear transport factor 2 family protein [Pseudoalteromonas sp. MMG024]MCF6458036.1 nuclear transport factor 2 family protein [Pseudoalteromonas sp. MMG024]